MAYNKSSYDVLFKHKINDTYWKLSWKLPRGAEYKSENLKLPVLEFFKKNEVLNLKSNKEELLWVFSSDTKFLYSPSESTKYSDVDNFDNRNSKKINLKFFDFFKSLEERIGMYIGPDEDIISYLKQNIDGFIASVKMYNLDVPEKYFHEKFNLFLSERYFWNLRVNWWKSYRNIRPIENTEARLFNDLKAFKKNLYSDSLTLLDNNLAQDENENNKFKKASEGLDWQKTSMSAPTNRLLNERQEIALKKTIAEKNYESFRKIIGEINLNEDEVQLLLRMHFTNYQNLISNEKIIPSYNIVFRESVNS